MFFEREGGGESGDAATDDRDAGHGSDRVPFAAPDERLPGAKARRYVGHFTRR
jgi:hypothetical protein